MPLVNVNEWLAGGFERAQLGVIDSSGYFVGKTTTTTTLTGDGMIQLQDPKTANIPRRGTRRLAIEAGDKLAGTIQFPSIEEGAFTLEIARMNQSVAALTMGNKVYAEEEWDMNSFDPADITYQSVCLLFSRKALSKEAGQVGTGWEHLLLYNCTMNYNGPGEFRTGTNEATYSYDVVFNRSTKTPWGRTLSTANDGTTEDSGKQFFTQGKFTLHSFLGDNSDTTAVLEYVPVSATLNTQFMVYEDGVKATTGITISSSTVTWGAAPGAAERDVILYEHA